MRGKRELGVLLAVCLLVSLFIPVMAADTQAETAVTVRTITTELTEADVSPDGAQAAAAESGSFSGTYGEQLDGLAGELYDAYRAYYIEQDGIGNMTHTLDEPLSFRAVPDADGSPKDDGAYDAVADEIFRAHQLAIGALLFDHPELFWIGASNGDGTVSLGSLELTMEASISGADETADYTVTGIRYQPAETTPGAAERKTAFEDGAASAEAAVRERAASEDPAALLKSAHDYLCETLTYRLDGGPYIFSAACAFLPDGANEAVCEGYAEAFKVLCDRLGIPCALVCGTAANPSGGQENHEWNAVMLDGSWYLVDVTWDDQAGGIRDTYFLSGLDAQGFHGTIGSERTADPSFAGSAFAFALPEISGSTYSGAASGGTGTGAVQYGDFTVEIKNGKASVVAYHGKSSHVETPTMVQGCPVTYIRAGAFSSNSSIVDLTIREGVTMMEGGAIYRCSNLLTVRLPATFQSGIVQNSGGVVVESGDGWVPCECPKLQHVVVAENNPYLTVNSDGAVYDKAMTTLLYWPQNNPSETLIVPEGVKRIHNSSCNNANHLREVRLPNTVRIIGYFAFQGASRLETINIPESCEAIYQHAFQNTGITSFHFPAKTRSVAPDALRIAVLESVSFDENNPSYTSVDGVWFDKEMQCLILWPQNKQATSYQIPDGVEWIEADAFREHLLTDIYVPETVTKIRSGNFHTVRADVTLHGYSGSACESYAAYWNIPFVSVGTVEAKTVQAGTFEGVDWELKSDGTMYILGPDKVPSGMFNGGLDFDVRDATDRIVVAEGITKIEDGGFCMARAGSIQLPESLVSIGANAFDEAFDHAATLTIPQNVREIDFMGVIDSSIKRYEVDPENPVFRSVDGILYNHSGTELIAYPPAADYRYFFTVPDSVTSIREYAFSDSSIHHLIIPDSVTSLGEGCFARNNIFVLHLGKGITELPSRAFFVQVPGELYLSGKLTSVGEGAFYGSRVRNLYYAYSEQDWNALRFEDSAATAFAKASLHFSVDCASPEVAITYSREPNCFSNAYDTYTCSVCGDQINETTVGPLGHDMEWVPEKEPTCTKDGALGFWRCRRCNCGYRDAEGSTPYHSWECIIPRLGHDDQDVVTAPTCTKRGYTTHTCSRCGRVIADHYVDAAGHKIEVRNFKAVSCTENGYDGDDVCTVCGATVRTGRVLKATGHQWDDGVVTREPTETEEGVRTYTCTVCGETDVEGIPKLTPGPLTNPFVDVLQEAYYYTPVLWAVHHDPQITNGTDEACFSPDRSCTRGEAVTFLWRAMGCPEPRAATCSFADVRQDAFYYKAVIWASEAGVAKGTSDTAFCPLDLCTRAQAVTFLCRAKKAGPESETLPFSDVPAGAYFTEPILWAAENSITTGIDNRLFAPFAPCTRGQIVTFLQRADKV